jgi:hypothetical protein
VTVLMVSLRLRLRSTVGWCLAAQAPTANKVVE